MNAFTMKFESRQLIISNQEQSREVTGQKKCKSLKKKNIASNSDKGALFYNHGLGRKFSNKVEPNNPSFDVPVKSDCSKRVRSKKECPKVDKMLTESDKIQDRLQRFLSNEDKEKIMCLLNDIRALSDIEKLYLYLQLPTGSSLEVDPFKQKIQNPLGKKADEEGMFAVIWIQSHLEEDPDVSLPKQEVYDEYHSYCTMSKTEPLCAADFGKVMKQIFPSVKPRRLGTRGNSRYCYSGLRKKFSIAPPSVPDVQKEKEKCLSEEEHMCDEVTSAACHLMFEWAEKLLGVKFTSLKELAAHLLENMYVDNRSVAAFTLLLDASPHLLTKGFSPESGCVKRSEAQFHLQRKIQEKELIKEQKRKLQEQRCTLTGNSSAASFISKSPKKKSPKSRKAKMISPELECDHTSDSSGQKNEEEEKLPGKDSKMVSSKETIKTKKSFIESHPSGDTLSVQVLDIPQSTLSQSPSSSETEEPAKSKSKILIPHSATPVCLAQSLPGILIVPSLPQLSSDVGKPSPNTPKYKRIQPKPLQGEAFSVIARSRAGSVGSSLPSKPKTRNVDGRRSSHAWLQSESGEERLLKNISSNAGTSFKTIQERNACSRNADTLKDGIHSETPHNNQKCSPSSKIKTVPSPCSVSNLMYEKRKKVSELPMKSNYIQANSFAEMDGNYSIKRHLDENDDHADNKRVHWDPYKLSLESSKISDINTTTSSQLSTGKQYVGVSHEEVNVHEIEGDALNDYFRSGLSHTTHYLQPNESQQLSSINKVQQLSQLRMLLEQNLPNAISKTAASFVKIHNVSKCVETILPDLTANSKKSFTPVLQASRKLMNSNIFIKNEADSPNGVDGSSFKRDTVVDSLERLLSSSYLASDAETHPDNRLESNPDVFLNDTQSSIQDLDINLQNELNQNSSATEILLSTNLLLDVDSAEKPASATVLSGRVSTCTQVPSVPQSPNTRRRAFNFMPISPRHTPVPEVMGANGLTSMSSPLLRTMVSTAVGPSQPPSNSGSPFVSPRSTPVPLCRSRHSSGQSTYSTSRHTPFQNFDSGVSSVSSSPFISPQPTPIPVSRLRHNSSHGSNKTVTFCSMNSPQVIQAGNNVPRSRHSSGPGAPNVVSNSSLSPLVSESISSFVFPMSSGSEVRSRHNSGSNTNTPFSPVSEQASSSSSCTSIVPDLLNVGDASLSTSQSFLNDGAGDLLISANPTNFKHVRHRHASSSVIYSKSSFFQKDIFSQEIQKLLKNYQENGTSDLSLTNRSQSVPLHQMLQTADGYCLLSQPVEDFSTKSHPSTPIMNQMFSFPSNQDTLGVDITVRDKSLVQAPQMEWTAFDGSPDLEAGSARRNLSSLYDAPPLSDDLQTTLEDLRDCDTDFSKLELELKQNDESVL